MIARADRSYPGHGRPGGGHGSTELHIERIVFVGLLMGCWAAGRALRSQSR